MLSRNVCVVLCCILSLSAPASYAAESWKDKEIMPKSDRLMLQDDPYKSPAQYTGTVFDIEWPATVQKVEGQWLKIEDDSGYSVPPKSGWVRAEDVLKLDDAYNHYMSELRKPANDLPWLHWFLGICLEKEKQNEGAWYEYNTAWKNGNYLLDAKIRLEHLRAEAGTNFARATDAAKEIGKITATASAQNRCQALYVQAEALRKAYNLALSDTKIPKESVDNLFKEADACYERAEKAGRSWWKSYLGRCELHLDKATGLLDGTVHPTKNVPLTKAVSGEELSENELSGDELSDKSEPVSGIEPQPAPTALKKQSDLISKLSKLSTMKDEDRHEVRKEAEAAAHHFNQVLKRKPDLVEAYRDRGLAYLLIARSKREVIEALGKYDSAREERVKVCDLCAGVAQDKTVALQAANEIAEKRIRSCLEGKGPQGQTHAAGADGKPKPEPSQSKDIAKANVELSRKAAELAGEEKRAATATDQEAEKALKAVYDVLNKDSDLKLASQSAYTACEKEDFAQIPSLQLLAEIHATLCDFDRAQRYQKLAVTYADDNERPAILDKLKEYQQKVLRAPDTTPPKAPPSGPDITVRLLSPATE